MSLFCASVWRDAQKGDHATAWSLEFCPGGSCLLALALMSLTSLTPCMPLVPFQLLPWCWSLEGMSLRTSKVLCGSFKRSVLRLPLFLLPPQPTMVFTARSYGDLPSWCWSSGLRGLVWGWTPHSRGIPPNFYLPHVDVGPPIPHLSLPFHLSVPLCRSLSLHPSYLSGWICHL